MIAQPTYEIQDLEPQYNLSESNNPQVKSLVNKLELVVPFKMINMKINDCYYSISILQDIPKVYYSNDSVVIYDCYYYSNYFYQYLRVCFIIIHMIYYLIIIDQNYYLILIPINYQLINDLIKRYFNLY